MKLEKINWRKFGRVVIFIDAANIIYSCKSLGWKIKYERVLKYFKKYCRLIDIYFYSAKKEGFEKSEKFIEIITGLGFKVRLRQLKIFRCEDGSPDPKGNIDGELIVDMIRFKERYDTAILMSGDSDFKYAIDYLRENHKRVVIISTKYHVSKELIDSANLYINLRDFKIFWAF